MVKFPIKVRHRVYRNYIYVVYGETTTHWLTDFPPSKVCGGFLLKENFEIVNA
jgi:hypothetical protein